MLTTSNLEKDLSVLVDIHDVIAISGAPGIGKSEITYQVCEEKGLKLLEVRLYEMGTTACGFPRLDNEITIFTKPEWLDLAEKKQVDVILFDDFHNVLPEIQKYFYRFLIDRTIHQHKLTHPVKVILAGNFDIESAGACMIESPIMGRIETMLKYEPSIATFTDWAMKQFDRFDTRVISFLKTNPDLLYTEDPAPTTKYASPRNWEHLSKNVKKLNSPKYATGIVGESAGSLFEDYWDYLNEKPENILKSTPKDGKEHVIYSIILGEEYVRTKDEKLKDQILLYVQEKVSPDAALLFSRHVASYDITSFVKKISENSKFENLYNGLLEVASNLLDH